MNKQLLNFLLLILTLFAMACAPEVKKTQIPDNKPLFGPKQTDVTLRFNGDPKLSEKLLSFKEQTFATADIFNTSENLWLLSYQLNRPNMGKLALQLQNAISNNKETSLGVGFESSPFAMAVLKEAKPEVIKELDAILKRIDAQLRLIIALLDSRTHSAPKGSRLPFNEFPRLVKERLLEEVTYLSNHSVEPIIIDSIKSAINNEVVPILQKSEPFIAELLNAQTLEKTLKALEKIFLVYQYHPTQEINQDLEFGYNIAHSIDNMKTEQAALTLIVQFWRLMTPKERLENFKPASSDLYEYLRARTESELNCLASDSCLDLIILVGKKKIFSGLRDYGLIKLQTTFNQGARSIVIEKIETKLPSEVAIIPQSMKQQIIPRLQQKTKDVLKIRNEFDGFLRGLLLGWAKQNLYTDQYQNVPLMEKNQIRLGLDDGKPVISSPSSAEPKFDFQTAGASFALTSLRWNSHSDVQPLNHSRTINIMRSMIDQINKLLVTYEQQPSDSLPKNKKYFDALATGELLRGLSKISYHLRDFEPTVFDLHLGRVQIGELDIDSLPRELAQRPLFPKETFYALAIGNAALLLKNLSTTPSPVFTVDTEEKIQWLDRAIDNPDSPNVMAGVVDIINGKRSQLVKSLSLSKFLMGLISFYKATENLDKTQAPRLLEKNGDGKTNLQVIMESRADIRSLILGLSNFLSHQIKTADGATLHSIHINETVVKNTGILFLDDQVQSIEALLDSYELLQTNMYLWSAIDTYYALNRKLWDPAVDFYYADSQRSQVSFAQRIATLHMIARLKNFLTGASKDQAERILHVNTRAFAR